MLPLSLSNSTLYGIMYGIIFILFIFAFALTPYFTITSDLFNLDYYYTYYTVTDVTSNETVNGKIIEIKDLISSIYDILILSIVIFVCFGFSFLTLFLESKKLNIVCNILILIALMGIIIIFHVAIYNSIYKDFDTMLINFGSKTKNFKTTDTAGYILTLVCTILMFITVVNSFITYL